MSITAIMSSVHGWFWVTTCGCPIRTFGPYQWRTLAEIDRLTWEFDHGPTCPDCFEVFE